MVSFEIFVKAMPPSLSELKGLPSFCFAFKIPDNVAASSKYRKWPVLLTFSTVFYADFANIVQNHADVIYGWYLIEHRISTFGHS